MKTDIERLIVNTLLVIVFLVVLNTVLSLVK